MSLLRILMVALVIAILAAIVTTLSGSAKAGTVPVMMSYQLSQKGPPAVPRSLRAFRWAKAHEAGCWYDYGGTGPCSRGFDCSGAVQRAFLAVGVHLPRTVADMLSGLNWRGRHYLVPIRPGQARKGDVVTWGDQHIEFVARGTRYTFGAHHSGTRVGTVPMWSAPHKFWKVR